MLFRAFSLRSAHRQDAFQGLLFREHLGKHAGDAQLLCSTALSRQHANQQASYACYACCANRRDSTTQLPVACAHNKLNQPFERLSNSLPDQAVVSGRHYRLRSDGVVR